MTAHKSPLTDTLTNIQMNPNNTVSSLANFMHEQSQNNLAGFSTNSNLNKYSGLFTRNEITRGSSAKLNNTLDQSASETLHMKLKKRSSLVETLANTTAETGGNVTGLCGKNFRRGNSQGLPGLGLNKSVLDRSSVCFEEQKSITKSQKRFSFVVKRESGVGNWPQIRSEKRIVRAEKNLTGAQLEMRDSLRNLTQVLRADSKVRRSAFWEQG